MRASASLRFFLGGGRACPVAVWIAVPVSVASCMPGHTRLAGFRRKAVVPCRVLRFAYVEAYVSRHFGPRRGWNALCLSCAVCGGIRKLVLQFPDGAGCLPSGARRMPGHTRSAGSRRDLAGKRSRRAVFCGLRMLGHTQTGVMAPGWGGTLPIRSATYVGAYAVQHIRTAHTPCVTSCHVPAVAQWGYAGNQGTGY